MLRHAHLLIKHFLLPAARVAHSLKMQTVKSVEDYLQPATPVNFFFIFLPVCVVAWLWVCLCVAWQGRADGAKPASRRTLAGLCYGGSWRRPHCWNH